MNKQTRIRANKILSRIGIYHDFLPVGEISDKLKEIGIEIPSWDGAIFCGRKGEDKAEITLNGEMVKNSVLLFQWYKDNGRFEINAYIT